jgi:hypothetical protein
MLFISLTILISIIVLIIDLKNRVIRLGLKTMEVVLKDQKFSDKGKIEDILERIDNEESIKTINKEINKDNKTVNDLKKEFEIRLKFIENFNIVMIFLSIFLMIFITKMMILENGVVVISFLHFISFGILIFNFTLLLCINRHLKVMKKKKEKKEQINTMLKEIKDDLQNLRKQAINNDNS